MSLLDTASLIVTPNGYKEGKLYSVIPSDGSGDLSVTRATTATRVNSAGLVELVPYNLLQYSEQLDDAAWTSINTTETIGATAPDGTATAWTLSKSAANGRLYQAPAVISGSMIFSVYVKAGTLNQVSLETGNSFRTLDLSTGTLVSGGSGTYYIESVGNGWYRFSIVDSAYSGVAIWVSPAANTSGNILVWHPQVNEGSTAKDYQKTETRLNIPRLDYSNGTCPSLLVEPQRTNELLYSSSFSSAAWNIRSNIAIDLNSTTSPDGNTNAAKMRVTNNSICDYGAFEVLTSGTRVFSVFAKKAELGYLYLGYENNVPSEGVFFNLNDGTISQNTSGLTANIEDFGNGWYRCSVNLVNKTNHFISPSANGTSFALTNQQNNGIYIWGAQAEAGSYATSYIPTTSASVTRNADVISKTGISSLIGQTEGVFYSEFTCDFKNPNGAIPIYLKGSGNSYTYSTYVQMGASNFNVLVFSNNAAQLSLNSGTLTDGQMVKMAFAYKANDFVLYINGNQASFYNGGTPSIGMYAIDFGTYYAAPDTFQYDGSIKAVALWKTRLTNTQLAQLTSI
jgi:hypothetical protein